MKNKILILLFFVFVANSIFAHNYKEDWKDLDNYPQAQWLGDLKFGMYWHWGLTSIPGNSGWYGKYMYDENSDSYKYHKEHFGDPSKFGYKDFIKLFTGSKFSAKTWIENTKNIGARFAVGMAVHHDGFDLFDSKINKWNSVNMNPHIDILGELEKEAKKQGLKFGATSHLAFNWNFFSEFMYPDKYDAKFAPDFYNIHDPNGEPSKKFAKTWYERTKELIDNYDLDFLWFDFGTKEKAFNEKYTKKITAHFYNKAEKEGKQVALAAKIGFNNNNSLVYDIEQGKFPYISKRIWMSDCTANSGWFNTRVKENPYVITGRYWLYQLIDIVSKNGTLLLNLGPNADGSWVKEWTDEMLKMGDWLKINGEAIYYTKPWFRFGEGPTMGGDSFVYNMGNSLTSNDVRFTRKGNTLYAIICGWQATPFNIKSLASDDIEGLKIKSVKMIGYDGNVTWEQHNDGLVVTFPKYKFGDYAYVLKIEGDNMFPEREEYVEMEIPFDFNGGKALENVKDVRVVLKGENKQLQLSELYVVGTAPKIHNKIHNMSIYGTSYSSSEIDGMPSNLINDNNLNGNLWMRSVAKTKLTNNPYLGVRFDWPVKVSGIIVYPEMHEREKLMKEANIQCFDCDGKLVYDKPFKDVVVSPKEKIIIPF